MKSKNYSVFAASILALLSVASYAASPKPSTAPPAVPLPIESAVTEQAPFVHLQEYERRLFPQHSCIGMGECAQYQRVSIDATGKDIDVQFEVHALSKTFIALPSLAGGQWVMKSNDARLARLKDGSTGYMVETGVTKLSFGIVPLASDVLLNFTKAPKHVSKSSKGWQIAYPEQGALNTIQIKRDAKADATSPAAKDGQGVGPKFDAPLFMDIHRHLVFDANGAEIMTTFTRLSPLEKPSSTTHALFAGEKILTESAQNAAENTMKVEFAAGNRQAIVTSRWDYKGAVELMAALAQDRRETWTVIAWNKAPLTFSGVDPVATNENAVASTFLPKPGEKLSIKPEMIVPVDGAQVAIDSSSLRQTTGSLRLDHTWAIRARSTIAAPLEVKVPASWKLEKAGNNGVYTSPTKKGDGYVLDLLPGANSIELSFSEERKSTGLVRAPQLSIGAATANLSWKVSVPNDEWVLFTWGPLMGPAVLIWGVLISMVVLSFALSKMVKSDFAPNFGGWIAVLVPLSVLSPWSALIVVAFVIAMDFKRARQSELKNSAWNSYQFLLMSLGVLSSFILMSGVYAGLLGVPNMMVVGNGSNANMLNWYSDRSVQDASVGLSAHFAAGAVLAPIWVWRIVMLVWALWIAATVAKRIPKMWAVLTLGGFWRKSEKPAAAASPKGSSDNSLAVEEVVEELPPGGK